jgi:hypothetical protein
MKNRKDQEESGLGSDIVESGIGCERYEQILLGKADGIGGGVRDQK